MAEDTSARTHGLLAWLGPGVRIAGYVLEKQIGAGGMAVVFRARDETLGRLAAVKILSPALAADEDFRARFMRESRAAATVDEPHIVPVYAAGEADGVLYIATRFVAGGDLRALLRRAGPLEVGRAAMLNAQVASALDAAHAAGLVHRDVKPANILVDTPLDRPEQAYLSDFGLSKGTLFTTGLTASGAFVGTPEYSAPEQATGLQVDGLTDQYALACVAFTMLAGAPPFSRSTPMAAIHAHLTEPPPPLSAMRPDVPRAADAVLARALAKTPRDRYPRCTEFAAALGEALGAPSRSRPHGPRHRRPADSFPSAGSRAGERQPAPSAPAAPAAVAATGDGQARRRRRRWLIAGVCALLVAVAVTAVLYIQRPSPGGTTLSFAGALSIPGGDGIGFVAFSADNEFLAASGFDQKDDVYVWNARTHKYLYTIPYPNGAIAGLAFSGHTDTLVVTGSGNTSSFNLLPDRFTSLNVPANKDAIDGTALSADGSTVATNGSSGAQTVLRNAASGARVATVTDPGGTVLAWALDGNGGVLALSSDDGNTYVFQVSTNKRLADLPTDNPKTPLTLSPDGSVLALEGISGADLWDVDTQTDITPNNPHWPAAGLDAFGFSPDSRTLATGSLSEVDLWNVATRAHIATVNVPGGGTVSVVAISSDGKTLLAADQGTVYLWHIS